MEPVRPPTILLVDDDEVVSRVLSRVLDRAGYRVVRAASAAQALDQAEDRPGLALLDFHLPDGDGVGLAKVLQARYPGLPAILITGCPFRIPRHAMDAVPFTQVLVKPLDLTGLREAVRTALAESHYARTNAS